MKKMIGILIFTLMIASVVNVYGQSIKISNDKYTINPLADDKWLRIYGGEDFDLGTYVQQTFDGGYIVVGTTQSYGHGGNDIWVIRTDNQGRLIWQKAYGGDYDEWGSDIQETSDGGYIITGSTESFGGGEKDVWLIKIDSDGNRVWDKTFGGLNNDGGSKVRETSDGGYIVIGSADDTGGPRGDIWLIKTNDNGKLLWDKKFGGVGHNHGSSIDLTSDGGFIIVGYSYIKDVTIGYDIWIIKTDGDGELVWDKKYHGDGSDQGYDIQQTSDGGYVIVGITGYAYPDCDIWLIKTYNNGEKQWEKVFREYARDQRGYSIKQTNDGGYIIAATTYIETIYGYNGLLIKTDSEGNEKWHTILGNFDNDVIVSVEQTIDSGYILTGYETSKFVTNLWLVKADKNGDIPNPRGGILFKSRLLNLLPNLFKILEKFLYTGFKNNLI